MYRNSPLIFRKGEVIKFTRNILNTGRNHYDTRSGKFRCPVTGLYFVTFTIRKDDRNKVLLGLDLNNEMILHGIDVNDNNFDTTVHNSRLVQCRRGEEIALKGIGDGKVHGDNDRKTTFSAMLLEGGNQGMYHKDIAV